ncbi:MAG TPA: rRNA maturation RNase YbeY [Bryobacteraceae bacterium]|nr:rRNA maturation RNase YbeY [Bryobacteraceae bacterium]
MSPDDDHIVLFRRAPAELRRAHLEEYARELREQVAGGRAFQCLVTDDRELRKLNRQFLGKDYPTDVLSFPEPGSGAIGELAISAQRAKAQAEEFGHPVVEEIRILMLHGVLHLLGMDHERDRGRMARAESLWRRKLGLPNSLIERVRP